MSKTLDKTIFALAVPNILANISVPLIGAVDTALMGHLAGTVHVGAVAIGTMIFNLLYMGFGFLRMGTTGLVAQAYGEQNTAKSGFYFVRALWFSLLFGLLMVLFSTPISEIAFWFADGSKEVEDSARLYFQYRILAAPATLALYVFSGFFYGMQNTRFPMYQIITTNLLNLGFNLLFIKVFDMKSDGVALGTVCAQYSGLIIASFLFYKTYRKNHFCFNFKKMLSNSSLKQFFSLNRDLMIRTLLLLTTFTWFTNRSGQLGDVILAANTILLHFVMLLSYGVDGFAHAVEALAGEAYGKRDFTALKATTKRCFVWGYGFAACYLLSLYLGFDLWISQFTPDPKVKLICSTLSIWLFISPITNTACFILDGVFVAATKAKAMRNSMIFAVVLVYFPVEYFSRQYGAHGLWLAMTMFMIARAVFLFSNRDKLFES
jgi:MATE family multidrug resistance protein